MKRGISIAAIGVGFLIIISSSVLAEDIRYDSGNRRDPLVPLVGPEGMVLNRRFDASGINVEGIIYDPNGGSLVLINGEFYKEGDHVNNANVISILQDRVILGQSDEEKTIWIREEIVNSGEKNGSQKKPAVKKPEPPKPAPKHK